jgi:2-oxoglutarate ferredoxin oxidoreductase subunit gamma
MIERIIVAGFGGQGVLSLGQFIAYAATDEGLFVTWLPSYGPEMRGGTANCSVVVSDKTVASPIIPSPDTLIAMNKPSLDKFINRVKPGGLVIVNSSLISDKVERTDVRVSYISANDIALDAGSTKTANIVILGAYLKLTGLLEKEEAIKAIEKIFASKPKVIPMNIKAFELGYNF